jgi:hypothetical protein
MYPTVGLGVTGKPPYACDTTIATLVSSLSAAAIQVSHVDSVATRDAQLPVIELFKLRQKSLPRRSLPVID